MDAMDDDSATPSQRGFADVEMGGFVGLNGSFCRKDIGGHVLFGFTVEDRHCNPFGLCHGGWLATMADLQLLFEAAEEAGWPTSKSRGDRDGNGDAGRMRTSRD